MLMSFTLEILAMLELSLTVVSFSQRRPGFSDQSVLFGFSMDKVVLGYISPSTSGFNIRLPFHPCFIFVHL